MKLFINDWHENQDTFVAGIEENREYPVNEWIKFKDGKQIYLASIYVYHEFVMFFYICAADFIYEYTDYMAYEAPKTNRDWVQKPRRGGFAHAFEYEINHMKNNQGGSSSCLPMPILDDILEEKMDEWTKMHDEEYDYLLGLMKERLPETLDGATLAFRKDCYAFEKPVDEIKHFAIFPYAHESHFHLIDKTFTMSFGCNDIKIEYSAGDTQSYVMPKELKVYDMRKLYNQRLLVISYLVPEKHRTFDFYLKDYLDANVADTAGNPIQIWLSHIDADDRLEDGYQRDAVLCEMHNDPEAEYDITLMWATDSIQHERHAVLEMTF